MAKSGSVKPSSDHFKLDDVVKRAAAQKNQQQGGKAAGGSGSSQVSEAKAKKETHRAVPIYLHSDDWRLLRRVALARAEERQAGRASISLVVADLIEQNRTKLEIEAEKIRE